MVVERCGAFLPLAGDKAGSVGYTENKSPTLRAESPTACVVGIDIYNKTTTGSVSKTLNSAATDSDHIPCVLLFNGETIGNTAKCLDQTSAKPYCNQGANIVLECYDARGNGGGKVVPTITGDHNGHMSDYTAIVCFSQDAYDKYEETEHGATLRASGGIYGGGSENLVCKPVYCLQGNGIDRADTAGCNGKGVKEGESYTLNTIDRHAVCCEEKTFYVVRRLTPLECCRLQGMPDWWLDGVDGSDAAKYKMFGNGMALPNALYVMEGFTDDER